MGSPMLTVEEVSEINQLNPKQQGLLMDVLAEIPEDLERSDFNRFNLGIVEDSDMVSFSFGISNHNGLMRDTFHIMINSHGKIVHCESNYGTGVNYIEDYDKIGRMKSAVLRFMGRIADWR